MSKIIYALVIIRRYKSIGDTASILTFDSREDAEKYAANKAAAAFEAEREMSTAIIEMMLYGGGITFPPSVTPTSFSAILNTITK